jgi:hypothetical protein
VPHLTSTLVIRFAARLLTNHELVSPVILMLNTSFMDPGTSNLFGASEGILTSSMLPDCNVDGL